MPDTAETIHADVRHLLRRLATIADEQLRLDDVKALRAMQKSLTGSIRLRSRWLGNATEPVTVVRSDDAGMPDDIVIADVDVFRMERMGDDVWWLACYRGGERMTMVLQCGYDRGEPSSALRISEDELGARDDSGDWSSDDAE